MARIEAAIAPAPIAPVREEPAPAVTPRPAEKPATSTPDAKPKRPSPPGPGRICPCHPFSDN
jgi:hypothetical protein